MNKSGAGGAGEAAQQVRRLADRLAGLRSWNTHIGKRKLIPKSCAQSPHKHIIAFIQAHRHTRTS